MRKLLIALSFLGVAGIIGGALYFGMMQLSSQPLQSTPAPTPTPEIATTPTPVATTSALQAGGNSHADPTGIFAFLYPNDYKSDTQNNGQHFRIYKIGATQRGQTEMYDGVIIVFETITLQGQTLSQWVDSRIKDSTSDGTLEIIQPKKSVTLNTYPGFTYTTRGLGEATYLILQKNPSSPNVLVITSSVNDPQNQGYQKEVDSLMSTIELLK